MKLMDLCPECARSLSESGFSVEGTSTYKKIKCAACTKQKIGNTFLVEKRKKEALHAEA